METTKDHYKILSFVATYFLSVHKQSVRDEPFIDILLIGGTKKGCIKVVVNVNKTLFSKEEYETAFVSNVDYDPKCNITNNLEKGGGTKNMFTTMLFFIKKSYPHVKLIGLEDYSKFDCDNNTEVPLNLHSVAFYGKSWYERSWNAYIRNETRRYEYAQDITSFKTEKKVIQEQLEYILMTSEHHDELLELYKEANTTEIFFKQILIKYGRFKSCDIVQPWIVPFMAFQLSNNYFASERWTIDLDKHNVRKNTNNNSNIKKYGFQTEKLPKEPIYQSGGHPRFNKRQYIGGDDI